MKPKKRQKLCYNCEGEVDLDVIVCPFCAADLREEPPKNSFSPMASSAKPLHGEQMLYPPPYSKPAEEAVPLDESLSEMPMMSEEEAVAPSSKGMFMAVALVTIGVQFFILSLLMVTCSHQGTLILKWNAHLWFLYFFASIPMLYFGYRALNKIS
ncbi:MAG: hypothetical protein KGJ02_04655 [Verrucomicrobiota bacterium]|nr:hypothetical protein [Verrucomicrobiota bacterium]